MKKLLALVAVVSLVSVNGFADYYNWGSQTYSQSTDLIVNSTGDKSTISEFITPTQNLGTNDFIGELAEKNLLATMGYTQALDYNPNAPVKFSADNGSNPYGTPLPTNVSYTPITIMGLEGDPRSAQTVWVPTSQYDALSNQSLNTRETTDAASISSLNTGLAATNSQVNTNTAGISSINNMSDPTTVLNRAVNGNTVAIANETVRATTVENSLYTGLNNETARAQGAEAGLQNQVNATNSRVDQLEKVKVMADLNVRILDTKKYTVGVFDMYDGTNQRNFAFGARLTYKLGKSYEEAQLEKQLKRIEALERVLTKIANQ